MTLYPVWLGSCFRVAALEDREYQMDRLEFVKNQLNLLIDDIKKKIKAISEDVESKVMYLHFGRRAWISKLVIQADAPSNEISVWSFWLSNLRPDSNTKVLMCSYVYLGVQCHGRGDQPSQCNCG